MQEIGLALRCAGVDRGHLAPPERGQDRVFGHRRRPLVAQITVEGAANPLSAKVVRVNPSAVSGSRAVLAYLAVEPSALDSPVRLAALLVGVNAGPLITPWASLATLLWAGRCRAAGLEVSWLRFAGLGAVLVPLCLVVGTGALLLSH